MFVNQDYHMNFRARDRLRASMSQLTENFEKHMRFFPPLYENRVVQSISFSHLYKPSHPNPNPSPPPTSIHRRPAPVPVPPHLASPVSSSPPLPQSDMGVTPSSPVPPASSPSAPPPPSTFPATSRRLSSLNSSSPPPSP